MHLVRGALCQTNHPRGHAVLPTRAVVPVKIVKLLFEKRHVPSARKHNTAWVQSALEQALARSSDTPPASNGALTSAAGGRTDTDYYS